MINQLSKKILPAIALSLALAFFGQPVLAESADSKEINDVVMTVSPAKIKLELKAGEKAEGSFKIINSGQAEFKAEIESKPYSIKDNKYVQYNLTKQTSFNQINRWISFDQDSYLLEPGKEQTVNFKVNTPESIPDGSQYGAIMIRAIPKKDSQKKANLTFHSQLGILVYAKTDGETKLGGKAKISSTPFFQTNSKLKISYSVKNTGNVDFENISTVTLEDIFGNVKFSDSQKNDILPNTTREISTAWDKAPAIGLFRLKINNELLGQKSNHTQYILFLNPIITIALVSILVSLTIGTIYIKKQK